MEITEDEVLAELLKNLKANKGLGQENIFPKFLKDSSCVIPSTMTNIFSRLLNGRLDLATIGRYLFSQLFLKYSRKLFI